MLLELPRSAAALQAGHATSQIEAAARTESGLWLEVVNRVVGVFAAETEVVSAPDIADVSARDPLVVAK